MSDNQPSKTEKSLKKAPIIRPRNPLATDPLMKKGGAHDAPKEDKRSHNKQTLKKSIPSILAEDE